MKKDRDILALQTDTLPDFFVDPEFETTIDLSSLDTFPAAFALLDVSLRNKFFSIYQLLGTSLCGFPDKFCSSIQFEFSTQAGFSL